MKRISYLILFALCVSCSGVEPKPLVPPAVEPPQEPGDSTATIIGARAIRISNQSSLLLWRSGLLAFDLFKTVSQKHDKNLFFSPYSMSAALGMLYNGASGKTKEEIAKVLRMSDFTPNEVNYYYKELTKALLEVDPHTSLSLANAIWGNKDVALKKQFIELNQGYYDAEISTLDFSLPSALQTINNWCNNKTNGTIPKVLEEINPAGLVLLANAVYFKSFWTNRFDESKTVDKPFYNQDSTVSTVSMMHQKELELRYFQTDKFSVVILPYANIAFALFLILPNEGEDINALIEELDATSWRDYLTLRCTTKVTLSMPRFKIEDNLEKLGDILTALGMESAFSNKADFTSMLDTEAYLSDFIQRSYISVDEKGTEAASVILGSLAAGELIPPPEKVTMVVDRPFAFLIAEQSTATILFMGKVVKL